MVCTDNIVFACFVFVPKSPEQVAMLLREISNPSFLETCEKE